MQLLTANVIILTAQRNIVDSAEIIQHGKSVKALRIPFALVVGSDLILFQRLNQEIQIPQFLDPMAHIAFEQVKAAALGKAGGKQLLYGDIEAGSQFINRFGGAFLQFRLSAANIIHGGIGNTAVFRKPVHGQVFLFYQFLHSHGTTAFHPYYNG